MTLRQKKKEGGRLGGSRRTFTDLVWQIGFLTEWQMYAQKLEGDSWIGERMDVGKIEKMSGMYSGKLELSGR
jgi:hypothetical protein